jgi:hypothetical protein
MVQAAIRTSVVPGLHFSEKFKPTVSTKHSLNGNAEVSKTRDQW